MGISRASVDGAALQPGPTLSLQGHLLSQVLLAVPQPPCTGTLRPTCNSEAQEGNASCLDKAYGASQIQGANFFPGAHSTVEKSRARRGSQR